MLEGLDISEVLFSDIDLGDRFDAEFYGKTDLKIEKNLKACNAIEMRYFGKFVASAFYPAATHLYQYGDIPFIRCVDCIDYPFINKSQDEIFEKIPLVFAEEQKGINFLNKGDMVITKVGTPCYASLVDELEQVALSRTVLGMKNITKINKHYLLVFLRSKYGFSQLLRHRELTIQYQLTLERTKRVLVFIPSAIFQNLIELLVNKQQNLSNVSRDLYKQAQNSLLNTISFERNKQSSLTVNFKLLKESFLATGRLDAEYYQPKYDQLFFHLSKLESKKLGEIVNIKKSIEPGSDAYQDTGIPFVRVSNLSKFGLTKPEIHLDANKYGNITLYPNKDTILLSKDGSVGIAYKVEEDMEIITSGALLHLNIIDDEFLPDYLTLVLNSPIVQLQAERDAGGSIIQHWKPSEIEEVIIPKLPLDSQKKISDLVLQSFKLKKQSQQLLEVAKKAVEIAIEQNEATAIDYINSYSELMQEDGNWD